LFFFYSERIVTSRSTFNLKKGTASVTRLEATSRSYVQLNVAEAGADVLARYGVLAGNADTATGVYAGILVATKHN
jgi:hypothetical protein